MPRSGVLMAGRVFAPDSGCSGLALPEVVAIGVLVEKGGGGDIAPVLGCYVGERGGGVFSTFSRVLLPDF